MEELWAQVQPIVTSTPVLLIVAGLLVVGLLKKLLQLAVFAGVLFALWVLLQYVGVPDVTQYLPVG